jgi:DNA repair photolyase
MNWDKTHINLQNGEIVEAQAPIIISASRSTDIPAFYSDWFVNRLKEGYTAWINPFKGAKSYVSFKNARLFVFWSKNPKPMLKQLDYLDEKVRNYYFQFTLNDYAKEKLEPFIPSLQSRLETFIELSERIGRSRVIWRFDPLILTDTIGVDELLRKVENIGNQLRNHTEKLVISFADIDIYKKVQKNLIKNSVRYKEFDEDSMIQFAAGLHKLNEGWKFEIGSCAEKIPLEDYGIRHNKCIDDDLIIRLYSHDQQLMDFLGAIVSPDGTIEKTKSNKDNGQREFCGCIWSKDIGAYNTCPYLCTYCYANGSKQTVMDNYNKYKENPFDETIKGV